MDENQKALEGLAEATRSARDRVENHIGAGTRPRMTADVTQERASRDPVLNRRTGHEDAIRIVENRIRRLDAELRGPHADADRVGLAARRAELESVADELRGSLLSAPDSSFR